VFEGQTYEVCTTVNSQVEARIVLLRDGRVLEETNANGEVCFDRTATQPGNHVYEVRALTTTETSTSSTSVRVLETDVEASSFPDQVASVESGDGLVKVELYNTHNELKRYNLDLQGLPSTWLSQSSKEVVLDSGERETVYFYLTPRDEGTYSPEIVVSGDNQEIYRENVDLEVGGQTEKQRRGLVSRLSSLFSL
jgi:predicted transcriptional regulator